MDERDYQIPIQPISVLCLNVSILPLNCWRDMYVYWKPGATEETEHTKGAMTTDKKTRRINHRICNDTVTMIGDMEAKLVTICMQCGPSPLTSMISIQMLPAPEMPIHTHRPNDTK
jgi:hypothetical protein